VTYYILKTELNMSEQEISKMSIATIQKLLLIHARAKELNKNVSG
jgi:hypothetical protein